MGVFAKVDTVFLADVIAIVDEFLIEEVELVVLCYHSHAGLGGKDLFGLDLEWEWGWLPFIEEPVVEEFACFSFEDERIGTGLKINNLFVFVELIVSAAERGKFKIAHDQRISPSPKNSSIIDTPAVDSAIVEQQQNKVVNSCKLLDLGVSLGNQLSNFLILLRHLIGMQHVGEVDQSWSPGIEVALVAQCR